MADIQNPFNRTNPFQKSIQSRTGGGRVAQQTQRDVKKVGDLAKTTGQAQRAQQQNIFSERSRLLGQQVQQTGEDIEFAKSMAQRDVQDYKEKVQQHWKKLMEAMEREKQKIANDLYGGQESAAMQQRFASLGQIAQTGIQALSTFVPMAQQNIQARQQQNAYDQQQVGQSAMDAYWGGNKIPIGNLSPTLSGLMGGY